MNQISEFWLDVRDNEKQIRAELARGGSKLQPAGGEACYIVSLTNRKARTEAGVVVLTEVRLAAQRVTEGSHRLASDEEIRSYLVEQERKRKIIEARAQQERSPLLTFVPPIKEVNRD